MMSSFLEIDGSFGEGGGQILRTALALSIISGKPFVIDHIRAHRKNPGLRPQHLQAVEAARIISQATVEGATPGSSTLTFSPGSLRSGRYSFKIGTAGATTLVLQTIYLPLARANSASTVQLYGGTHVPWSPCYHYLEYQWAPWLEALGFSLHLQLIKAGFYPQGGGHISATIRALKNLKPLQIEQRGSMKEIVGLSAVANLPLEIAKRQKKQALLRLSQELPCDEIQPKISIAQLPAFNKGTVLILAAKFTHGSACYFSLGELGKPAEKVADEAVDQLLKFLNTPAAIDEFCADQLLLPLALALGESRFMTPRLTDHLVTNAAIIQKFLDVYISIQGERDQPAWVQLSPQSS